MCCSLCFVSCGTWLVCVGRGVCCWMQVMYCLPAYYLLYNPVKLSTTWFVVAAVLHVVGTSVHAHLCLLLQLVVCRLALTPPPPT